MRRCVDGIGGGASETYVGEGIQNTSDRARPVSGSSSASREWNWKRSVLNNYEQDVLMVTQQDKLTKIRSVETRAASQIYPPQDIQHNPKGALCQHCE